MVVTLQFMNAHDESGFPGFLNSLKLKVRPIITFVESVTARPNFLLRHPAKAQFSTPSWMPKH